MTAEHWEDIYAAGEQLNRYPFSTVVSFFFRNRPTPIDGTLRALDVGCGSGMHSGFLAEQGAVVTAFDVSASSIAFARQAFGASAISYHVASLQDAPLEGEGFDVVVDHCVTTHTSLEQTRGFYQGLRRHLRPGAQLFWQGFSSDNGFLAFGTRHADGTYTDFTQGVFKPLGRVCFFSREDIYSVFEGYTVKSLLHLSQTEDSTGIAHTSWIAEVSYEGTV